LKKRKAKPDIVIEHYRQWYLKHFKDEAPVATIVRPKLTNNKPIVYRRLVKVVYRAVVDTGPIDVFEKYLNFVFKSWAHCDGAGINHWPSWLASSAMIERFADESKKRELVGGQRISATYSDHAYAGDSEDMPMDEL